MSITAQTPWMSPPCPPPPGAPTARFDATAFTDVSDLKVYVALISPSGVEACVPAPAVTSLDVVTLTVGDRSLVVDRCTTPPLRHMTPAGHPVHRCVQKEART